MTEENKPTEGQTNLFADQVDKANSDRAESNEAPAMNENSGSDDEFERGEQVETGSFSKRAKGKQDYSKIGVDEEFPAEGMWLTFESIAPGIICANDKPLESQYGKYFERKLIVKFEEEFNERKLQEMLSKVTFSIFNGVIQEPRIKAACDEEDLDDQFTQDIAKFRYLFHKAFPDTPEDQSDAEFIEALFNTQCRWEKVVKSWKKPGDKEKTKYAKLVPKEFRAKQ